MYSVTTSTEGQGKSIEARSSSGYDVPSGASPQASIALGEAQGDRSTDLVRKPDAGNPHVRFDERGLETWLGEPD